MDAPMNTQKLGNKRKGGRSWMAAQTLSFACSTS